MAFENPSNKTYFLLLVFSDRLVVKIWLFVLFLAIYLVTLMANLLLIMVRIIDPRLHTPMYFFLSHLAFIDISYTTAISPKILNGFLTGDTSISFLGCALQMWFTLHMGGTECLLLAVMAYDRHAAICLPLHYHTLMSHRICFLLAASCWVCGFLSSFLHTVFTFLLPFCKSRDIGHFFCEIQPLLKLACGDTHAHEMWLFATALTIVLCCFLLTLCSYVHIISTILKIQSAEGKSKVFSTCSSHLLVVVLLYGTIMSIYMRPISTYTPERDRVVVLMYTVVNPMLNPLIYSLRNNEVKAAIVKAKGKIQYAVFSLSFKRIICQEKAL